MSLAATIKDEMRSTRARGVLQEAICETPIGRCVDYLETRNDVDMTRIAVCDSSLVGFYAARRLLQTSTRSGNPAEPSGAFGE